MQYIYNLVQFFLHIDQFLGNFVQAYGIWVYALLFVIIFVETGLVIFPFLPGDSLLFVVGALCGTDHMSLPLSLGLLTLAAILGNQCNYSIGRYFGPKVFHWENSHFFNKAAFDATHAFYEKRGGITLIAARFFPFIRTFAPFVAGVANMTRAKFTLYDISGAVLWIGSLVLAGYFFGSIPFVKTHLEKFILAAFLIPGIVIIYKGLKLKYQSRKSKIQQS